MRDATIWTVLVVVVVLAMFLPAAEGAFDASAETRAVTNESITVDYANETPVDAPAATVGFSDHVTIHNSSDAQLVGNGTDYDWNATTGNVSWINTTNTTDGETAAISYEYDIRPEQTRIAAALLRPFSWVALIFLLVTFGAAVYYTFGGFMGGGF